jgi:hypothetical protein
MDGGIMLLIRNGYAVSTRQGFLGVLFPALLAFALFDPGAAIAQEVKQIKLTPPVSQPRLAQDRRGFFVKCAFTPAASFLRMASWPPHAVAA